MADAIITPGCLYRLTFPNGKAYIGITKYSAVAYWKSPERRNNRKALSNESRK